LKIITVKIEVKNKQSKALIKLLKTFDFVEFFDNKPSLKQRINKTIIAAENEIKEGKTTKLDVNNIQESLGIK